MIGIQIPDYQVPNRLIMASGIGVNKPWPVHFNIDNWVNYRWLRRRFDWHYQWRTRLTWNAPRIDNSVNYRLPAADSGRFPRFYQRETKDFRCFRSFPQFSIHLAPTPSPISTRVLNYRLMTTNKSISSSEMIHRRRSLAPLRIARANHLRWPIQPGGCRSFPAV